jgi:hypothetical protein
MIKKDSKIIITLIFSVLLSKDLKALMPINKVRKSRKSMLLQVTGSLLIRNKHLEGIKQMRS